MARRHHKPTWKRFVRDTKKLVRSKRFARWYFGVSIAILAGTTVFWSILGASIESTNADQVANTFLLDGGATTSGAVLPTQHTFLLKIPFFWLVNWFGATPTAFAVMTVVLCLATVAGFAFILSRIEKRPLVLGTVFLALGALLLYIPAQSYPGSLLPANFAMLTTRNIEYVLFFGALITALRAVSFRSWTILISATLFGLLFASDKLFISLGIGMALIALVTFLLFKRRDLVRVAIRVLVAMAAGYVISLIVITPLRLTGVHFDDGSALGPYGLVHTPKDFVIAIVYAILGIATNLGANPAYDAVVIKDIPSHLLSGIVSPAGLGYIATIGLVVIAVRIAIALVKGLQKHPRGKRPKVEWQSALPLFAVASVLSAFLIYIVSNHYYPADSRYEAIALFAGILLFTLSFKGRVKPLRVAVFGLIFAVASIFGIMFQLHNARLQHVATDEITARNGIVQTALLSHHVSTLVGDYWRVLPIRLKSPTTSVTPLEGCSTERSVLSSSAWQPDLKTTSFAYLLRLDGTSANFPHCTLSQVTDAYGRPNSSVVIAGTRSQPKELLLFYDDGINHLQAPSERNTPSDTVTPISLSAMPFTTCQNTTIMQFVAHEDDDILFMNPDLNHDIAAGNCIRTVYFTAGDAGGDNLYWLGRQHGTEAAYNQMLGTPDASWTERIVALDDTHLVTIANPTNNHRISLIFFHLPDGNTDGSGFASEDYESLAKLYDRSLPVINPVDDHDSSYTYGDLSSNLVRLMNAYSPSQIRTQSTYAGETIKDHSDHNTVGEFTTLAYGIYKNTHDDASLAYYIGYPVHERDPNVEGADYDQKVATFLAFSQFDPAACQTIDECNNDSVYGIYLQRQYTSPF